MQGKNSQVWDGSTSSVVLLNIKRGFTKDQAWFYQRSGVVLS
jgi:hypothetical protein